MNNENKVKELANKFKDFSNKENPKYNNKIYNVMAKLGLDFNELNNLPDYELDYLINQHAEESAANIEYSWDKIHNTITLCFVYSDVNGLQDEFYRIGKFINKMHKTKNVFLLDFTIIGSLISITLSYK